MVSWISKSLMFSQISMRQRHDLWVVPTTQPTNLQLLQTYIFYTIYDRFFVLTKNTSRMFSFSVHSLHTFCILLSSEIHYSSHNYYCWFLRFIIKLRFWFCILFFVSSSSHFLLWNLFLIFHPWVGNLHN